MAVLKVFAHKLCLHGLKKLCMPAAFDFNNSSYSVIGFTILSLRDSIYINVCPFTSVYLNLSVNYDSFSLEIFIKKSLDIIWEIILSNGMIVFSNLIP